MIPFFLGMSWHAKWSGHPLRQRSKPKKPQPEWARRRRLSFDQVRPGSKGIENSSQTFKYVKKFFYSFYSFKFSNVRIQMYV